MATLKLTTVQEIANELGKHDDCLAHKDWGVELYCNGCNWNAGKWTEVKSITVFKDENEAYRAYDFHLAEAIATALWGAK